MPRDCNSCNTYLWQMQYPQNERFFRLSIVQAIWIGIYISLLFFFIPKKERLVRLLVCFNPSGKREPPYRNLSFSMKQSFQPRENRMRQVCKLLYFSFDPEMKKKQYVEKNDVEELEETERRRIAHAGRASPFRKFTFPNKKSDKKLNYFIRHPAACFRFGNVRYL